MLLCYWKQFYVSLDKYLRQAMFLYSWKQFYASLDKSVRQGILFSDFSVGRNSILNFPAQNVQECAEPFCVVTGDDSSHCQGNLEKGFPWPPKAIPHGLDGTIGLVLTQPIYPTPWT